MAEEMQVKSKQRVAEHGEVFTSQREVNAMLDLVKHETQRIDSRFLEPACGDGNFLAEILRRKLTIVEARYKKNQLDFERNAITAISSIYGIDILEDNVKACRERLLGIFTEFYSRAYRDKIKPQCVETAKYILNKNIIYGDALKLTIGQEEREPIIFSEWSFTSGSMLKRRDFTLENLVVSVHGSLFSDLGDDAYIPKPIKEFPVTHFLEISKYN